MKEFFETIFLLASIQGVLLSLMLFLRKENHLANIFLSLGILALSSELFTAVYYSKGWYRDYPWFMGVTYSVAYLYGPIFYFYTKLLTKKIEKVSLINILHLLPFAAGYLVLLPLFLMPLPERLVSVEGMLFGKESFVYTLYEALIPFQGIIYTTLTVKLVINYNKKIRERFSNIEKINLDWLKYLAIGMIGCWFFSAVSTIIVLFIPNDKDFVIALHTAISILIYSIGYLGLRQPEIFMKPSDDSPEEVSAEKYKKSGLDETAAEEIKTKLLLLIETEKPYLDSELTLNKLAEMISVSSHNLSEVINSKLGKTYYDFINEYRVDEFKKKLEDASNQNFNLISIAFDSGFNSKTSFNTVFKKITGQTPSEYRAGLQRKSG
jgi:AraC-like DNA-binding protein